MWAWRKQHPKNLKQFGQKAHGYFELVGEHKGTTSNFVKTLISEEIYFFEEQRYLIPGPAFVAKRQLYSLKLTEEGLSPTLLSGTFLYFWCSVSQL